MDKIRFTEEDPIYQFQENILDKIQSSERSINLHVDNKMYDQSVLVKSLMQYLKDYDEFFKKKLLLKVLLISQSISFVIIILFIVFYYMLGFPIISNDMVIYKNPSKVMTDDNNVYLEL